MTRPGGIVLLWARRLAGQWVHTAIGDGSRTTFLVPAGWTHERLRG
jgi:hypothetical protein